MLSQDLPKIKQVVPIFIAIELLNLVALYTGQLAVKLGVPVLVSAIEASTPAYAFGLSLLIAIWQRRIDRESRHKLPLKWGFVGLMIMGGWLLGVT